jgi:predicted O-methyltransferase YrrM
MANYRFFVDYVSHYLTSKTRHGVHSPFVYHLVDEVIYDYSGKEYEIEIEALRSSLKRDKRILKLTDLGAGSMLNKQLEKSVGNIARHSLKPPRVAKLITRLAAFSRAKTVIELGTCLGITTSYLAKALPSAQVITVEGCAETAGVAQENFDKFSLSNIDLKIGNFDLILPQIIQKQERIDFLFIDGNHRKEATLAYFYLCLDKVHDETMLIFDDIYWSQGMKEAWTEIKNHPQVTVTVDLFFIGLVFFKKDQAKEDFKIRFR